MGTGKYFISLKTKPYSDPLLINEEIMELISFVL